MSIGFAKGHGTENDFVLVRGDEIGELTPALVQALCDRRRGLGADGVLGIAAARPGTAAEWFMDYRNADGSIGEMCGNGIRLLGRYLVESGLAAAGAVPIATRAGLRTLEVPATGDVTVDMGAPGWPAGRPSVAGVAGVAVSMGNPHVVVPVPDEDHLAVLDLAVAPTVSPPLPGGQNVEYVVRTGPRSVRLRVHERGVGETRSCGTGVCAAVVAAIGPEPGASGRDEPWSVQVPGGRLTVHWTAAGTVLLTGPAVVVARGTLDENWLATVR